MEKKGETYKDFWRTMWPKNRGNFAKVVCGTSSINSSLLMLAYHITSFLAIVVSLLVSCFYGCYYMAEKPLSLA